VLTHQLPEGEAMRLVRHERKAYFLVDRYDAYLAPAAGLSGTATGEVRLYGLPVVEDEELARRLLAIDT
jgi:hypothetical protein